MRPPCPALPCPASRPGAVEPPLPWAGCLGSVGPGPAAGGHIPHREGSALAGEEERVRGALASVSPSAVVGPSLCWSQCGEEGNCPPPLRMPHSWPNTGGACCLGPQPLALPISFLTGALLRPGMQRGWLFSLCTGQEGLGGTRPFPLIYFWKNFRSFSFFFGGGVGVVTLYLALNANPNSVCGVECGAGCGVERGAARARGR